MSQHATVESFGNRGRVAALVERVADVTVGNRDGVIGNESSAPNVIEQRHRCTVGAYVGWGLWPAATLDQKAARLRAFLDGAEERWGTPVTALSRPSHVSPADWATFRVGKAAMLERFGLHPKDVVERVVSARGAVDGVDVQRRELFVQRYRPLAPWNGTTVVMAPGYGQTSRTFAEQAVLAAQAGYEVVVFDQQWLGLSQGTRGAVDRGFGVARDIAAITADAAAQARSEGRRAHVIIAGTSMGALGAVLAIVMNERGRLALEDGPPMPERVGAVLQAPYFGLHPSLVPLVRAATFVPGLRWLQVPRRRVGGVTDDAVAANKLLGHAVIERATSRLQAFTAADADRDRVWHVAETSAHDPSPIHVIHAVRDPLASYVATETWCGRLGPRATLRRLESANHAFAESPVEQRYLLAELDQVRVRMQGNRAGPQ